MMIYECSSIYIHLSFRPYEVDLYRYELILLACKYCITGIGDVITWVSERSALTKWSSSIMQCAFNLSNNEILWSRITTGFKIWERPIVYVCVLLCVCMCACACLYVSVSVY